MAASDSRLKIKVQLFCGSEIAMGPGKAALLEAIEEFGSISAAGRALGMSYRRTWQLVDVMNRCWREPLVETAAGGAKGGGARLTRAGSELLRHYRSLLQQVDEAASGEPLSALTEALLPEPKPARAN